MADMAEDPPLVIGSAEGSWLVDTDSNRYLDGVSSMWTNVLGHHHPTIDDAIRRQLDLVSHSTLLGSANAPSIILAEKLVEITPDPLCWVFYSDNGATSVEIALKMAFQYQQQRPDPKPGKTKFIALSDSYHGDTVGAVSVGGIPIFHSTYGPLLFDKITAPAPYLLRCGHGPSYDERYRWCIGELERLMESHGDELAAFIIEPLMQGAGGMIDHRKGYLRHVRQLCNEHDLLLIADEVAVGFGKTGKMFACDQEEVVPDLICLAKGLTAGYLPLAATLTTDRVYEAFLGGPEKTFYHGHTFTGNQLGCAAALASLEVFGAERTLERLAAKTGHLASGLGKLSEHPHIAEIRRQGVMVGIELMRSVEDMIEFPPDTGKKVCRRARDLGVIVRPLGNVVVLMPPLSVTLEEIDLLVDAVATAIDQVTGEI